MFCKKCGAEMADTDKVCASCGAPVEEAPVVETPAVAKAPAAKGQIDPLRLSALICQSVGALFMMIFCFQLMNYFSSASLAFDLMGVGFITPLVTLMTLCAAAAAVFVPVCLWLDFAGKQTGNGKLSEQGKKLLPISILVQLIVEAVIYGLMILLMLVGMASSEVQSTMSVVGGNMAMTVLGLIVMAAAVIFLHVMALKLTKGGAPDMVSAVACFVAGGVHVLTWLFMMGGATNLLLLGGFAAADIIYGLIIMQKVQK